jgi:hypothetical protein
LKDDIIDFLLGYREETVHWDRAVERDDIYAEAAVQKQDTHDIFVKIHPILHPWIDILYSVVVLLHIQNRDVRKTIQEVSRVR